MLMLDTQIHMYSVDTGHFYSNREKYLHDMNRRYRGEHNDISHQLPALEKQLKNSGYTATDLKLFQNSDTFEEIPITVKQGSAPAIRKYIHWIRLIRHKKEKAVKTKEKLLKLISNKIGQNERTDGKDHIRQIREEQLRDTNIVSVFTSALTRAIGIPGNTLTDTLLIVQIYYYDIFKDLSFYGFLYKGEKYRYFTSSAGQIRKKKALFIKESVWNTIEKTIVCGLTVGKINARGGNNVNKHLAYMALANSATDEWKDFDIDRCIVIDDFETNVPGTFDFIDEKDYSITRKNGVVPITHTDGAGMMLPAVMQKNTMFRAPWIKGLLGVFDFRKFIKINGCSPVITDIYGKDHDVIREDIHIIFTKSQFKMYRFYDSWEEYKYYFKTCRCQAGICSTEETRIGNAKINYQMLQTLTDITDEEIDLLVARSATKIANICNSRDAMMDVLGITPYNTNMTPFQQAVKLYPALLNDTYAKDILRDVKNSLLKKYRSGKLEINGKYTFLLPDFYAACEYWFGHIKTPTGLLADHEVFCWLYKQYDKLDCLRSPHLYKEHAIRSNIANKSCKDRAEKIREWFSTNALYTSSFDLISKILQFDVDGDKSLVIADPDFIRIAERNMEGVVPLYYNMRKAEPEKLNRQTIYTGLNMAFTYGNIGMYSNNIAKIWNSDIFVNGSKEEQQKAADVIKLLCMENNFCIDAAKTLYMPQRAPGFGELLSRYTNGKLPAFFEFAKDKEPSQTAERNQSFVNQIFSRIPDQPINTRKLNLDTLEYKKLMAHGDIVCPKEVSDLYDDLNRKYRYKINMKDEYADNLRYVALSVRKEFEKLGYSEDTIADMLVHYLYGGKKRAKQLLWFCYGQSIVNHLKQNLTIKKTKLIQCVDCGEWIEVPLNSRSNRCGRCRKEAKKSYQRQLMQKRRTCSSARKTY